MHEKKAPTKVREVDSRIPRFRIEHGLRPKLIDQLVAKSKADPNIVKFTHDATGRFSSAEAVSDWLQKGRDVYVLTPRQALAGIAWYGEKKYPFDIDSEPTGLPRHVISDPTRFPRHTFAIRLYDKYQGRGLARQFMDDTLQDYLQTLYLNGQADQLKGLWLSVNVMNQKAKQLYSTYGYSRVGTIDTSDRGGTIEDIMVLSNAKIYEKITGA